MIALLGYYIDGRRFCEGFNSAAEALAFRMTRDCKVMRRVEATEDELRQARLRLKSFEALMQRGKPA